MAEVRRILTAREQRHGWHRSALEFPWQVTERYPKFGPEARTEEARLENGHTMAVSSGQWGGGGTHNMFWDYHITDPRGETLAYRGMGQSPPHLIMRRADEAKAEAEKKYREMFPLGTNTGPHDSGVDYSDLNRFMREASAEFPWRKTQWENAQDYVYNLHEAPLENGHSLQAHSWNDKPELGWTWYIHAPGNHPQGWHDDNWPASGGAGTAHSGLNAHHTDHFIPDEATAKAQAEAKYRELFPIGTDTGGHDSGVDYSDLSKFKDYL